MKRLVSAALVALALILAACEQAPAPAVATTPSWLVGEWRGDQASVDAGWRYLHVTLDGTTTELPRGVESEADGFRSYAAAGFLLQEGDNGYLRLTTPDGAVHLLLHVREGA